MLAKLKNLLSRKFLIAVAGLVCGIMTIIGGEATEGVILIASSVLGYLVAEGYIDAKAVASAVDTISNVADIVDEATDNETLEQAAETVGEIADAVGERITQN